MTTEHAGEFIDAPRPPTSLPSSSMPTDDMTTDAGAHPASDGSLQTAADSAEGVAAVRAVAAAAAREIPTAGVDTLAIEMLSPAARTRLPSAAQLDAALPGLLYTEAARVTFFDEYMLGELTCGVDQVAILAAGFDTRAYRFRSALRNATVYEIDRAAMLEVKASRVREGLPPVANVRPVTARLGQDDLDHALTGAGLRDDRPTAVLACGISMYLQPATFESILAWVGARLAPGSSMAVDYVYRRMVDGDDRYRGAAHVRARLAAAGEHQILGFDEGELATAARRHGLVVELDLGPTAISDRYLRDGQGRLAGEPLGYHQLAVLRGPRPAT